MLFILSVAIKLSRASLVMLNVVVVSWRLPLQSGKSVQLLSHVIMISCPGANVIKLSTSVVYGFS